MRIFIHALNACMLFANTVMLFWLIPTIFFHEYSNSPDKYKDSLVAALQLGRLDLVSILMTIITIALVFAGIFSYLHFRHVAEKEAQETAGRVASAQVEIRMQQEMPLIVQRLYRVMLDNEISAVDANAIAEAQ